MKRPPRKTRLSVRMDSETAERLRVMARERGETRDITARVIVAAAWASHQAAKGGDGVRGALKDWVAERYEHAEDGGLTLKQIRDAYHFKSRVELPLPVVDRALTELGAKSSAPDGGERVYHLHPRPPRRKVDKDGG